MTKLLRISKQNQHTHTERRKHTYTQITHSIWTTSRAYSKLINCKLLLAFSFYCFGVLCCFRDGGREERTIYGRKWKSKSRRNLKKKQCYQCSLSDVTAVAVVGHLFERKMHAIPLIRCIQNNRLYNSIHAYDQYDVEYAAVALTAIGLVHISLVVSAASLFSQDQRRAHTQPHWNTPQ